jgi:hypothetical protein
MMEIAVIGRVEGGRLLVDVATDLPEGEVRLTVAVSDTAKPTLGQGGTFSSLLKDGRRLSWAGDPVAEQRRLRDEWPE